MDVLWTYGVLTPPKLSEQQTWQLNNDTRWKNEPIELSAEDSQAIVEIVGRAMEAAKNVVLSRIEKPDDAMEHHKKLFHTVKAIYRTIAERATKLEKDYG